MDHVIVIVTNYEGQLTLYRGDNLPALIREVLSSEGDFPPDLGPEEEAAEVFHQCWEFPTLSALEQALAAIDVGMVYSGPSVTNGIYTDHPGAQP